MISKGGLVTAFRQARAQAAICRRHLAECHDHLRQLQGRRSEQIAIDMINCRITGLRAEIEAYTTKMDEYRAAVIGMIESECETKWPEREADKLLN